MNSEVSVSECYVGGNYAESSGGGIFVRGGSAVQRFSGNWIDNNTAFANGGGMFTESFSFWDSTFTENCVYSNNSAIYGGGLYVNNDTTAIINSTFYGNSGGTGSAIYGYHSKLYLANSLITESLSGAAVMLDNDSNIDILYSLFYDNEVGNFSGLNIPPRFEILSATNLNGDSCDVYGNIFLDPAFQATTGDSAYRLTADSPCIDAGDPESPLDPDSTIADIGAYYFHQTTGIDVEAFSDSPSVFRLHPPYPNPFNASTTIRFDLSEAGIVSLDIYAVTGRSVGAQNFVPGNDMPFKRYMPAGSHEFTFNAENLSSGLYFIRLQTGEFKSVRKVMLLK